MPRTARYNTGYMVARVLIGFPTEDAPGLHAEAAQLALGLAACGHDVLALGPLGPWRHQLRRAQITATEFAFIGDTRKLTKLIKEFEPQIIHAFGTVTSHQLLPLAMLTGAGGIATLGHDDLPRLNPADFQNASAIFVPCDHLRDQVARRLTSPVITAGNLLPPADDMPVEGNRFLAEELGLTERAPMVLLADSLHDTEADTALSLIETAPLLADRVPGVQIMIAGDGNRLDELADRAAVVNEQCGYRAVLMPGHRDDIPQLLALATVAVGSGRFALEAIGAGVALVAAGAAGMVGAYTEETASICHFTCFGRHGRLEPVMARALATEIAGLFTYAQLREQFAAEGQQVALAAWERSTRAAQIAIYYTHAAASGTTIHTPQRILAILPDDTREMLFTLPAISALREHFPLAQIRMVASPLHEKFLEQLQLAERVIVKPRAAREWPRYLREQRLRADICLAFSSDFLSAMLTACSFSPHRLGFADGGGSIFFSDHLQARTPPSPARALTLVSSMGVSVGTPIPRPVLSPETQETVDLSLLAAGITSTDSLILLSPAAGDAQSWPPECWLTLASLLLASRPERIAVLGSPEMAWPEGVIKVMPVQDTAVMAALLARADLFIAADSAALHLADLLGAVTVGLYGPTSPESCGLPNNASHPVCHSEYPCHPCGGSVCAERHCIRAITPDEVMRAIMAVGEMVGA